MVIANARPLANLVSDLDGDGIKEIVVFDVNPSNFSVEVYKRDDVNDDFYFHAILFTFAEPTFFISLNPNYTQNTLRIRDVGNDLDNDIVLTMGVGSEPAIYLFENLLNFRTVTNNKNIEIEPVSYTHLTLPTICSV